MPSIPLVIKYMPLLSRSFCFRTRVAFSSSDISPDSTTIMAIFRMRPLFCSRTLRISFAIDCSLYLQSGFSSGGLEYADWLQSKIMSAHAGMYFRLTFGHYTLIIPSFIPWRSLRVSKWCPNSTLSNDSRLEFIISVTKWCRYVLPMRVTTGYMSGIVRDSGYYAI